MTSNDNVHRYLAVPFWLIEHPELTQAEHYVYAYVLGFDTAKKQCFAGVTHLAAALRLSERSIIRARLKLKQLGLLVRRQDSRTGRVYHTTLVDVADTIQTGTDEDAAEVQSDTCQNVTPLANCHPEGDKMSPHSDKMSPQGDKMSPPRCQNVTHINLYTRSDTNLVMRENTPLPPNPPQEGTKDWFDFQAEKYLAVPTGNEPWERDSQYVSGGRRPMTKFPSLWFTRSELASAIEVVRDALPDDDIKPVFRLAEAEAMTKQIDRGGRKIPAYKYVTGHCLQNHLETLTKTTRLAKTRSKS